MVRTSWFIITERPHLIYSSFLLILLYFTFIAYIATKYLLWFVYMFLVWLLWPHGLYPTWLLCPWDFPGRNTGVGCHLSQLLELNHNVYKLNKYLLKLRVMVREILSILLSMYIWKYSEKFKFETWKPLAYRTLKPPALLCMMST